MGAFFNLAVVGAGVYFASKYLNTGYQLMNLQYSPVGVKINHKGTNLQNLSMTLSVNVLNPNKRTINFESLAGVLSVANSKGPVIAFIKTPLDLKPVPLEYYNQTTIQVPFNVPATISNAKLVSELFTNLVLNGTKPDVGLYFKGQIVANGKQYPINETFDLG
jgi:hypothetical protein